ncbi:hypothetical protein NDI52_31520 [Leptolyngbya sp. PL-A3]|uniref:hypothetical protein n=1 Tax=Leptolyngbya sp. PL-A3 TaxID=2933911 RepID=UPI003299DD38
MKLPPGCWCLAREAGQAPTSWVNSYAGTSQVQGRTEWIERWLRRKAIAFLPDAIA